jgi:NAD(P)-dependent dehydrogenase (short-subunit alcohol dehydrogenase family)
MNITGSTVVVTGGQRGLELALVDGFLAEEIDAVRSAFLGALGRPAAQARIQTLFERGFHQPGDVETRLGHHVGLLGDVEQV